MRALAVHRDARPDELVGRVLCHDVHRAFRKGHALCQDDLPALFEAAWTELHLLELDAEDVGQRDAGRRLAEALANSSFRELGETSLWSDGRFGRRSSRDNPTAEAAVAPQAARANFANPVLSTASGLRVAPSGHRHVLQTEHRGLLKIDAEALHRLNSIPGVAVFTLPNDRVVEAEKVVVEAQITPLAIHTSAIEEAERIAREQPIVRLLPFAARDVILWRRDDRFVPPLLEKLAAFDCPVLEILDLSCVTTTLEHRRDAATLFLISGANALDPLDPVFQTLDRIGARIIRHGVPTHPGTLLWIAAWGDARIMGLPSCGLGPQLTAFDLVLPKLLAGDEDYSSLGHGGILLR